MIGTYEDITLCGRDDDRFYFKASEGKKIALKNNLSKKDLAIYLKVAPEDAKFFREEAWLMAADLKAWVHPDEATSFWRT